MAEITQNYGLVKPEEHEYYSIGIQNENMEKIDEALTNKGNGAVWYATEVVQSNSENNYHIINATIPNFVFSENCIVIAKLSELDHTKLDSSRRWMLIIWDSGVVRGTFRLISGGHKSIHTIENQMLYGNQIITVALSKSILDPLAVDPNTALGTAFLSTFPGSREFYSLEQLGFTPADFSLDTADTAIEKLIDSMPTMATLRVNLPQTNILAEIFRSRVLRDVGADWPWGSVLEIKKTIDKWQPNKITLLRNMGSGSETQEVYTYYDNTLGTFKPANVGSNKNLLHNWDFTNPVNQRGFTELTQEGPWWGYTIDRWGIWALEGVECTIKKQTDGLSLSGSGISDSFYLEQRLEKLEHGTYTLSAIINGELKVATLHYTGVWVGVEPLSGVSFIIVPTGADSNVVSVVIAVHTGISISVSKVKLELGSVSTLANDPPADYGEQLALCQRYCLKLGGDARATYCSKDHIVFNIPTPTTLRVTPALVSGTLIAKTFYNPVADFGFELVDMWLIQGHIQIRLSKMDHGLIDALLFLEGVIVSADL